MICTKCHQECATYSVPFSGGEADEVLYDNYSWCCDGEVEEE